MKHIITFILVGFMAISANERLQHKSLHFVHNSQITHGHKIKPIQSVIVDSAPVLNVLPTVDEPLIICEPFVDKQCAAKKRLYIQ